MRHGIFWLSEQDEHHGASSLILSFF